MDRYAEREKEVWKLTKEIKNDIIEVYKEKGYTGKGIGYFLFSCIEGFKGIEVTGNTLYFIGEDDTLWHSDNVNGINRLMALLKASYHIIPYYSE